jgi:hypothetical protein
MKFEIKNRWSGEILFSVEVETWRFAIEAAIKAKADLSVIRADFCSIFLRKMKTSV